MMNDQENTPPVTYGSTDPASPDHAPVKKTVDARAGVTFGRMRWVLAISILAVVIAFLVVWEITPHH